MSRLRAVKDGEATPAKKSKPATLKAAADSSERELLVKMRDDISDAVSAGVPAHTLAPLMRQLREIDKEIRTVDLRMAEESNRASGGTVNSSYDASAI